MIGYFLGAEDAQLHAMGVDRGQLPSRGAWLEAALLDHKRPDTLKDRAYLAWDYQGTMVGHSSVNKIKFADAAYIHLHLWDRALRQSGLGTRFFQASVAHFQRVFGLRRLYCEPYAGNPAPNRVLQKSGFRLIKRYRTVPGPFNFEQEVNLYVLESFPDGTDPVRIESAG